MTAGTGKPASLADIVASATRAERTVSICVAGHLNARYDELEERLQAAVRESSLSGSLADGDDRRGIATEMESVRQEMLDNEHDFTFRALPAREWSDLFTRHAPRPDKREAFNNDTFPLACVAASLVSINGETAVVTEDDLRPLWNDKLNGGQRDALFGAAWEANTGRVSVPFSATASATLMTSAEK